MTHHALEGISRAPCRIPRHESVRRTVGHGIGRTYAGTYVRLLVHDLQPRVVDLASGELLRELTLDPTRDYQPQHPK